MIELKEITFLNNDKNILNKFNLKIKQGDFICFTGNNGTGKTTLALIIAGVLNNYEGQYFLKNKSVSEKEIRKNIGMLFQNPEDQIFASIVKNDIAFGLENKKIDPKEMDSIIDSVLDKVDLLKYKNSPINILSGGQKQRVALASILAMDFSIYLFDEATSMLDVETSNKIMKILIDLNKKGKTIIIISHKEEEIKLANRVIKFK